MSRYHLRIITGLLAQLGRVILIAIVKLHSSLKIKKNTFPTYIVNIAITVVNAGSSSCITANFPFMFIGTEISRLRH